MPVSKKTAGFDRFIFILLGIILVALGSWPILLHFDVNFARHLELWVNHDAWATVPEQGWWPWALGGIAAVALIAGVWLIVANVRVRRINEVTSGASDDKGSIALQMAPLAAGMAASLQEHDFISEVDRKVAVDRGQPQLTLTITASPETPLVTLRQLVEETEADFRAAFPDSKLHTVYRVHYSKLKALG